ncbi:hypothetical protein AVEN_214783-1 [Araneus ventricosus]|uniref:Transposase Tc1-like domain-containing protein n=1 Tax=Araneus ventricosus TaxID=182803 RepID=A0A4Y2UFD1_ARAVE|nr:hypothetical protein AVEN_214783-1 [Araneus ventricosus]
MRRQSDVARDLNVHRSVIHMLWNHYQRDKKSTSRRGSGRRRIATTVDDLYLLQCSRRRRTLTARQLASQLCCCWKGLYLAILCRADCMKDCSHDDLLFVCFCLQLTSE